MASTPDLFRNPMWDTEPQHEEFIYPDGGNLTPTVEGSRPILERIAGGSSKETKIIAETSFKYNPHLQGLVLLLQRIIPRWLI